MTSALLINGNALRDFGEICLLVAVLARVLYVILRHEWKPKNEPAYGRGSVERWRRIWILLPLSGLSPLLQYRSPNDKQAQMYTNNEVKFLRCGVIPRYPGAAAFEACYTLVCRANLTCKKGPFRRFLSGACQFA